jgi:hypothetical protein
MLWTMTPRYIANFDSTAAMLRALGHFLKGRDFPALGVGPHILKPAAQFINRLPHSVRETIYTWSGWAEAISPRRLSSVNAERLSRWAVSEYPQQKRQAVAIGSSSGAMVHLCAALQIPWLPQTFLIPVARSGIHPDEPKADLEWGKEPGRTLLDANPELQLHHMNDANQDRLMIQRMTYFRVKRLTLGQAYEQFLQKTLEPGGTIFLMESQLRWPTVQIGDRHIFQHGALGGATPDEFLHGSQRVEAYLQRYNSPYRRWDSPGGDAQRPEAEWGFEAALRDDVVRFAKQHGYRVRRIVYEEPEHLSPLVADLYRWWYRERRILSNRLLVGSFVVHEPYWTLKTGSLPFWMTFNKEPSADLLEEYLDHAPTFDDIYLMLFSHGVESVGLVPIERWRAILGRARKQGRFIGVNEREYPRDFAAFVRYNTDVQSIPARYPMPGPLTLHQFDMFLKQSEEDYAVRILDDPHAPPPKSQWGELPRTTSLERD